MEFYGSEEKYITLSYSSSSDSVFFINFTDLNNNTCEYSISVVLNPKSDVSAISKEEHDKLYAMVVDIIKSCIFLNE